MVARAKFVEVFNLPTDILRTESVLLAQNAMVRDGQESISLHPVDSFSFGWLDRMSISQETGKPDSFFVLFPSPNDDPWSTHAPILTFYGLEANSTANEEPDIPPTVVAQCSTPHIFSEKFLNSVSQSPSTSPTSTSSSTSTKIVVGRHRTALWVSPRPREWDITGLVQVDLDRRDDWPSQARGVRILRDFSADDLVWASIAQRESKTEISTEGDGNQILEEDSKTPIFTKRIINSRGEDWTAIGYDEETGRVALGRRDGFITFLRL